MPRRILRVALLLASALIGVLLSEGVVRVFAPQPLIQLRPDIWIPVAGVGHQKAANVDTVINTGEGEVRLVTDERGHRIGAQGPPRGARKILAVGDSFVEGLQVDYPELATTRLADMLELHAASHRSTDSGSREYAVINTGVSDWSPNHYYRKVHEELSADDYDLVLLFVFLGNDVVTHMRTWHAPRSEFGIPVRMPRSLDHRELVDAWVYPLYLQLRARSHLVVFLKRRFLSQLLRLGLSGDPFGRIYLTSHAESPRWSMTVGLLQQTVALATESQTRAVVVLIPPDFVVDKVLGRTYAAGQGVDLRLLDLDQPARLLGERLRDAGITTLDSTPRFEALHKSGVQLYGRVDRHLNRRGHDELAKFILPRVVEELSKGTGPARTKLRPGNGWTSEPPRHVRNSPRAQPARAKPASHRLRAKPHYSAPLP